MILTLEQQLKHAQHDVVILEAKIRVANRANKPKMKTVKNLLSGIYIQIPVDTPRSCDPSTELYHCM